MCIMIRWHFVLFIVNRAIVALSPPLIEFNLVCIQDAKYAIINHCVIIYIFFAFFRKNTDYRIINKILQKKKRNPNDYPDAKYLTKKTFFMYTVIATKSTRNM